MIHSIHWVESLRPRMKTWKEGIPFRFCEEKMDGWRVTIVKDGGRVSVWTRKDDIVGRLMKTKLRTFLNDIPNHTVLDCEIFAAGRPATSVLTSIHEDWPELKLAVFAAPFLRNRDCRLDVLWRDRVDSLSFVRGPAVFPRRYPYTDIATYDELLSLATKKKLEGLVLKQCHYDGWFKLKPQKTLDAVIVGWKEGKGKYLCTTGAIEVAVRDPKTKQNVIIASCSGMTDDQREEMCEMHRTGSLIGKVVEVMYQSVGSKGRLQFPRFVRWREDKPAHLCSMDQLC